MHPDIVYPDRTGVNSAVITMGMFIFYAMRFLCGLAWVFKFTASLQKLAYLGPNTVPSLG